MRYELKENEGLPLSLLWSMCIMAGFSVANIYYNQPLLNMIKMEFGVSEFLSNMIAMVSQIGYAIGLLFVIPLGDLYQRRNIIISSFTVLIISLACIANAPNIYILLAASLFTGICSVIPQIFIPIAAMYSKPEHKGRNVGMVVSGLLTGILASRIISGIVGEMIGWRQMYIIAAILMLICCIICIKIIPNIKPTFRGNYSELMSSLFKILKEYPTLRIYAVRSGFAFGSFLALWSSLAFKMAEKPFYAGSDIVGELGLCGIAGALSASFLGKYVSRFGIRRFNFLGCLIMAISWSIMYVYSNSYVGLISGIILIDIGMQCIQLSNQTGIFSLCPSASNRMNTIFMTTYFIGGSTGTLLSGTAWHWAGWTGTVITGLSLVLLSFLITLISKK